MDVEQLRGQMKRQRAELFALQLLVDGLLLALPKEPRGVVQRQFEQQSERWLADALGLAKSDETVHDMQRAVDRLKKRVGVLMTL